MYTIQTVYQREDIEGFYNAFLYGKQVFRTSKKILRVFSIILAMPFWLFAAFIFIAQLFTGNIQLILTGLPMTAIFIGVGLFLYSCGRTRFKNKASWRAYPNKGETLTYYFCDENYSLTQPNSVTEMKYSGLVRLCEDTKCFYLFTTPQTAHILPKRDIAADEVESFRSFISAISELQFERINS